MTIHDRWAMLVGAAALALAGSARAWEVACYTRASYTDGTRIPCKTDDEKISGIWDGEHAALCRKVLERAGLRERIVGSRACCRQNLTGRPVLMSVATNTTDVDCTGDAGVKIYDAFYGHCKDGWQLTETCPSFSKESLLDAIKDSPNLKAQCELAELPDFAFGLNDLASHFQAPPPIPGPNHHDYPSRIGLLNSTHFGDQASAMYRHYHAMALGLAKRCKDDEDVYNNAIPDSLQTPRVNRLSFFHAVQCEALALGVEAVGQHYLEDRWAVGHMWQRWGSPRPEDFPSVEVGLLVAAVTGFIHGASAMIPGAVDPMNAPSDQVSWGFADGSDRFPGVGDVYVNQLLNDARYQTQLDWLMGCGAAGFTEVYLAGPQTDGALPSAVAATVDGKCLAPLATNEAIARSTGVTSADGHDLDIHSIVDLLNMSQVAKSLHFDEEYPKLVLTLAARGGIDPNGLSLASGALMPDLFGMRPGSAYLSYVPPLYGDAAWPWPNVIGDPDHSPMADLMTANWPQFDREMAQSVDWPRLDLLKALCKASGLKDDGSDPGNLNNICLRCESVFWDVVSDYRDPQEVRPASCPQYGASGLRWERQICANDTFICEKNPSQCSAVFVPLGNNYCYDQINAERSWVSACPQ